jgi:mannose-6-phosphate isomerase-like protein (cupin superfamily)
MVMDTLIDTAAMEWKPWEKEGGRIKYPHEGYEGLPTTRIVEYPPGHEEGRHKHGEGAVYYFLGGSGTVGDNEVHEGTMMFIGNGVEYGPLKAGPEGFVFLRITVND